MHAGHRALNVHTHPMEIDADGAFGVRRTALPLTSGHTPMMDMGATGDRMFTTDIAFECHRRYTIPYAGRTLQ